MHPATTRSTAVDVGLFHTFDRRRVLLTALSTFPWRISRVCDKVPEESILIFRGRPTLNFLITLYAKGSSHAQNRLYQSSRFDTIPACDRQPQEDSICRATIIIIIIIKGIYIAQVRKGHKCAMSAEMAVWLRNCLYLYSYLSHN